MKIFLRCGSQAYLIGRGANVLIGLRHGHPIVWHRSGTYRWDHVEHPWDLMSDIPPWGAMKPIGPRHNDVLIEQFMARGMKKSAAYDACHEISRHYREQVGRFVFGDIVFHELDNDHWCVETFDENGQFMIGHGYCLWEGEPEPKRTGKFIRFNGVVN